MGLAPLHTWLPDAHSEAPSVVSALLSGARSTVRFWHPSHAAGCSAAGLGEFAQQVLLVFGLISMALAAVFIVGRPTTNGCWPTPASSTWESWPWAWGWAGLGTFAAPAACGQPLADQGDALPPGGQYPLGLSHQIDRGRYRHASSYPGDGRSLDGGPFRDHRFAAVWHLYQRVDDPPGGPATGPPLDRRRAIYVRCAGDDRHGLRRPEDALWPRTGRRGIVRESRWSRCRRSSLRRWSWCSGLLIPHS